MEKRLWFKTICSKNHFIVSDLQVKLIGHFCDELLSWNKKINLISRRDEENVWTRHILGSISFLFHFQPEQDSAVLDLGSGGGLPGIPLAILRPDLQFTLVDSIQKKVNAVKEILLTLPATNVVAVCSRAEDLAGNHEYQHAFDYIIARAVAPMKDIIQWSKPLLKPSDKNSGEFKQGIERTHRLPRGSIVLLKGGVLTDELEETQRKLNPRAMIPFPLPVDGIDSAELPDKKLVVIYP